MKGARDCHARRKGYRFALCAILTLAACDDPPAARDVATPAPPVPPAQPAASIDYGNRYSEELASRSYDERARLLSILATSAGESCPGTGQKHEYKGHDGAKAFWAVDCGASDFLIQIDGDSSTSILACAVMRRLSKDDCWAPWKGDGAATE